jgi:hypothetical protein
MASTLLRSLAPMLAPLLLATAAMAQSPAGQCHGFGLDEDPSLAILGVVDGSDRVRFIANSDQVQGCPSEAPRCARRAFLVPGDQVVMVRREGGFACVSFVGRQGARTDGWVPLARLTDAFPEPRWSGTWKRDTTAVIMIGSSSGGPLALSGHATMGPAPNVGEIEGRIDGSRRYAAFAISESETQIEFDMAGQFDCAVRLAQLGPYLVVKDNLHCGGLNVTFNGVYVRQ